LPKETLEIIEAIDEKDPLDIIWENIQIQYAAILRAQNIMHVESKDEMIKELKKKKESYSDNGESNEIEYEFQFAWDRQATFLNAQSRAMSELRSLIKQYDEMLHKNWDLATAEQKARIDKLNFEISNLMGPKKSDSNSVQIVDDIDD
jgi:phage terminase small subunit